MIPAVCAVAALAYLTTGLAGNAPVLAWGGFCVMILADEQPAPAGADSLSIRTKPRPSRLGRGLVLLDPAVIPELGCAQFW